MICKSPSDCIEVEGSRGLGKASEEALLDDCVKAVSKEGEGATEVKGMGWLERISGALVLEEVVFVCVGLVAVVVGSIWTGWLEEGGNGSIDDKSGVGCSVKRVDKYVVLRSLALREEGRRGGGDDPGITRKSSPLVSVHAENTRLLT